MHIFSNHCVAGKHSPVSQASSRAPTTVLCIAHVNSDAARRPHVLQAAECADGMLRVFLDGEPMGESVWPAARVNQCIDMFLATKAKLLRDGGVPPNARLSEAMS